jgi:hypothetical protein
MAWIKRRKTAERYDVATRTVARWEADPKLKFPTSMLRNGRRYDNEDELDAWDAECAAAGRTARTPADSSPNDREAKATSTTA